MSNKTTIYVKNMVCPRCVSAVIQILKQLKIPFSEVTLGRIIADTETIDFTALDNALRQIGFEIIQNKNEQLVEQIKTSILVYINDDKGEYLKGNISHFLSKRIGYDYTYLSTVFSKKEKTTIEKLVIEQRIKRVQELIKYNELNFSEIAYKLNYSSASHLSKQFKKVTGQTLTDFKKSLK